MKSNRRMPVYKKDFRRVSERGLSMIEVLLSLIVLSVTVVFFTRAQLDANKQLESKQTAEAMEDFTAMASDYLLSNKDGIINAMIDGTGASSWCVINANTSTGVGTVANNTTLHTCAVDVSYLKYKKVVPANYAELNQYKQRWTAIYRLVYADYANTGGAPTQEGSVEMLVVGAKNGGAETSAEASDALLAASIAGYTGGYIPNGQWGNCKYNGTAKTACGSSGGWKVDLSQFLNTP